MKKYLALFLLLFLSVGIGSAVVWDSKVVYDETDDSSINSSLWNYTTTTSGTGTVSVGEGASYIELNTHTNNPGSGQSWAQTAELFSIDLSTSGITNLTFRSYLKGYNSYASEKGDKGILTVFGNQIKEVLTTTADDSIWSFIRNISAGVGKYDVYDDGVFDSQITSTDTNITIQSFSRASNDNGASQNGISRLYYVYVQYDESALTITQNSPDGATTLLPDTAFEFNITSATSINELKNITLYIDGAVNETKDITGTTNETLFDGIFSIGQVEWTTRVCDTGDNCKYSGENTTITFGFEENAEEVTLITTEGIDNDFILNITVASGSDLTVARLWYNGEIQPSSMNQDSPQNYILSSSVTAPTVSATTNYTFHWEIILAGTSLNQSIREQQVNNLGIDNCGAYSTLILNYTLKDEENLLETNITNQNPIIELDVDISPKGSTTPIIEFSQNYTNVTTAQVCLENALGSAEYRMDVVARYKTDTRVTEFNNMQNLTLSSSNIPQNIDLLDLLSDDSQEFLIKFKDDSFSPVSEALIVVTRKYISEGIFRTVEAPLTNVDGEAIVHLVIADVIYTINVLKDGVLLATFDNVVARCSDITIGACELKLSAFSTGVDPIDYTTINDLTYMMSFSQDTRTITVSFVVPSGAVSTVLLNATLYNQFGNQSVCGDSLTSSSGTLTCLVPTSYGNTTIQAILTKDGTIINSALYTIKQKVNDLFGGTGYIFLLLLYMTLPLMLVTTGVGMVIGAIIGLILGALLSLFNTNNIIGVGSTILWFIIAGGIITWKVSKRE